MELHEKGHGFTLYGKIRKAKIQAVATDMASGYMAAVLEHLPEADLVLDRFHLVKWFNEKLSLLRRQLYLQATEMQKAVLKGSRWLLLKAPENLKSHRNPRKDERIRLQAALALRLPQSLRSFAMIWLQHFLRYTYCLVGEHLVRASQ